MFNSVTADRISSLPPVEGVDVKRIPQILSKVYAHIVGLKAKYEVGVLHFEAEEIRDDYEMLNNLAFTLELYLESGRFEEKNDAIAFVTAMSHKLMGKLKGQSAESLTAEAVPSELASVLLFIIGGYTADAEEASHLLKKAEKDSEAAWRLKEDISLLAKGRLSDILDAEEVRADGTSIAQYAQDLLWMHLSKGIVGLSERLTGKENADGYDLYFNKVAELAVYVDKETGWRYDYPGISRLARLLRMACTSLESQSVLKVVNQYITTSDHYEKLQNIATRRPYLWRNHIDAINRGFLKGGVSSVITFPTGAGKSTLVELKVIQHVAVGGKVVYIVPTHALEYQVRNNMARLFDVDEYKNLSIGREFTTESEDDMPVMVMTPERCSTLLTLNPKVFEDVTLVMMDEFHIIGEDGHRSVGAMHCIITLLAVLPKADFVMVSAMVENGSEMAGWIGDATGRECLNLAMAWKPTSQLQGCIVYDMKRRKELEQLADVDKRNRGKRKGPSSALRRQLLAEPRCLFSLRNTWESDNTEDYYMTSMLDHQVLLGVNNYWRLTGNRNQVAKELAKKFAALGMKTILFVENPVQANSLVKQLNAETESHPIPKVIKRRLDSIVEEFGDGECTYLTAEMGAVPHHSLLLPEERLAMEALFRGKSDIMIATPTLAQGVNLPVDVVLIAGEDRYDAEKDGRDRMDAHEILNAAGRAGRAGFRSQGAAIIVSNKVIGMEANALTEEWFALKKDVFSKGDQCLTVSDPFGKMDEETIEDAMVTEEQRLVLMKLNLAGANERKILKKSLYAYQLKQNGKSVDEFVDRVVNLSSQFDVEGSSPLMDLSLKTGVDRKLLEAFYNWLGDVGPDLDASVGDLLKLYCGWLYRYPMALQKLLTYESTLEVLLKTIGSATLDRDMVKKLHRLLQMFIKGCPLIAISRNLNEKASDTKLTATRKFVLRIIPELSYAFSVLAMVHIQYLIDEGWNEMDIPENIKNFSTYLKEGVTSEEMLKFKAARRLMRVECHNRFEE